MPIFCVDYRVLIEVEESRTNSEPLKRKSVAVVSLLATYNKRRFACFYFAIVQYFVTKSFC